MSEMVGVVGGAGYPQQSFFKKTFQNTSEEMFVMNFFKYDCQHKKNLLFGYRK